MMQFPAILAVIFVLTIWLCWMMPGSPVANPDRITSPAIEEAMLRQYRMESPWTFGISYLEGLVAGRDGHRAPYFGPSLQSQDFTVNELLADRLPVSIALGAAALGLAVLIGMLAGIAGALKPGSLLEGASVGMALLGVSLPAFVTGSLFLALSAWLLGWVPLRGWEWPGLAIWTSTWWVDFREMVAGMLLPALTLSLAPAAYVARLVRLGLGEILRSDFARTARAKGLSEARVLFDHALKPAFLPVLSFLGPAAATTLTGSFVIEMIFAIPGVGRLFVDSVLTKDLFVLMGIVLVYSTMLVTFNLLVDLAYGLIDPRIEMR
ncbi:MAG: ABC transporter permease [Phycisphaeraceae bacterium]|nr:ABC transporter permease [Phycisphaeraceae bacterium]